MAAQATLSGTDRVDHDMVCIVQAVASTDYIGGYLCDVILLVYDA
jgi:hypothetical protein